VGGRGYHHLNPARAIGGGNIEINIGAGRHRRNEIPYSREYVGGLIHKRGAAGCEDADLGHSVRSVAMKTKFDHIILPEQTFAGADSAGGV